VNCYAAQLAPALAKRLGVSTNKIGHLGRLAVNYTRARAPRSYWNANQCRDGGKWDILPAKTLG
jgi:hypothetical protein